MKYVFLVLVCAFVLYAIVSLVMAIVKHHKLKKQTLANQQKEDQKEVDEANSLEMNNALDGVVNEDVSNEKE